MKWLAALIMLAAPAAAEDLRIGTTEDYSPYINTAPDGTRSGIDAEMMAAICDMGEFNCTWVQMPFFALFDALQSGDLDVAVGGIGKTAERDQIVDFTCLYDIADVNTTSLYTRSRTTDLTDPVVGVIRESLFEVASEQAGYRTRGFPNGKSVLEALLNDEIDALLDGGIFENIDPVDAGLVYRMDIPMPTAGAAIAVTEARPDLRDRMNGYLSELSADGRLGAMQARWLEADQGDIVADCFSRQFTS